MSTSEAALKSWIDRDAADFWIRRQMCPACHVGPNQPCRNIEGYHEDRKMDAAWAAERLLKQIKEF